MVVAKVVMIQFSGFKLLFNSLKVVFQDLCITVA